MSMTILKNHHTFDVFWIKRRAVKGVNYTKIVCHSHSPDIVAPSSNLPLYGESDFSATLRILW